MKPESRSAFTLIEVLVVTAIIALTIGVIGACLAAGLRVWDSARTCNRAEGQMSIGLAILEKDLMNGAPFFGIEFQGEPGRMTFPGPVRDPQTGRASEEEAVERIGVIEYAFDARSGVLWRDARPFPSSDQAISRPEAVLSGLFSLQFQFEGSPDGASAPVWQDQWRSSSNFPVAVSMDMSFQGAGPAGVRRIFNLPLGRGRNDANDATKKP